MEDIAVVMRQYPSNCSVGRFLRIEMAEMAEANRVYFKKRGTERLLQLLANSFWKAPCRSALIFDVINMRAVAARSEAVGITQAQVSTAKGAGI